MRKIPTLFLREHETGGQKVNWARKSWQVTDQVRPGCEWVLEGKGIATRKWDGLCCLVKDGRLWKRVIVKNGEHCPTDSSVEWVNYDDGIVWVPVGDGPEDKWHREAWRTFVTNDGYGNGLADSLDPGATPQTYELCGPEIKGNPEGLDQHVLMRHGEEERDAQVTFKPLLGYLRAMICPIEGIVWWHKDDEDKPYHERRLCQVTRKDFGLEWP